MINKKFSPATKILSNSKLSLISSILVFLFSATILVSGKSYSFIAIILCILALLILPITIKNKIPVSFYVLAAALSSYFFTTTLSIFYYGGSSSNLDIPSRTLIVLPALLYLLHYPPKKEWILKGILLGSFISGLIALYHKNILGIRAFSDFKYMVIQSGDIAMSLGVFSFLISIHYKKENRRIWTFCALFASFFGVLASLLSEARGGWVVTPFVVIWILFVNRHFLTRKMVFSILFMGVLLSAISYQIVDKRISKVLSEINEFSQQNKTESSSGARIELWKSGLYAFAEKPIFGIGYKNRENFNKQLINDGKVSKNILKHTRLHNSYIEELSTKGIIGLVVLLLFFGVPLLLFYKLKNNKSNLFYQLGIIHIVLVMGYCLTQNYINHHSGMLHYLIFLIIFYSAARLHSNNLPNGKKV